MIPCRFLGTVPVSILELNTTMQLTVCRIARRSLPFRLVSNGLLSDRSFAPEACETNFDRPEPAPAAENRGALKSVGPERAHGDRRVFSGSFVPEVPLLRRHGLVRPWGTIRDDFSLFGLGPGAPDSASKSSVPRSGSKHPAQDVGSSSVAAQWTRVAENTRVSAVIRSPIPISPRSEDLRARKGPSGPNGPFRDLRARRVLLRRIRRHGFVQP